MGTAVLSPRLTELDAAVLALLPSEGPGVRAAHVHRQLTSRRQRHNLGISDVILILRGFEHLGTAQQRRGWWTR